MSNNMVSKDPNVLGGTPVFMGTRIPIAVLFDNLADGLTLDEILDSYPTLTRKAALLALQEAEALLERDSLSGSAIKGFFYHRVQMGSER
jgi:uncharacterized protein (DUF433 family)